MMQQQGFRPDACVYNVVLEALVSSGLVSAQAKAVQLCAVAVSGPGRAGARQGMDDGRSLGRCSDMAGGAGRPGQLRRRAS